MVDRSWEMERRIMKWQIHGRHLRLRVDEDELALLLAGDVISDSTAFGTAFVIRYAVSLGDVARPELHGDASEWRLSLPAEAVRGLAARLPSRDGLAFEVSTSAPDPLELLFDVDVRDSTRKRYPR
jgi:hypothetical protein